MNRENREIVAALRMEFQAMQCSRPLKIESERKLSERLSVGRQRIREVINELVAEGLLIKYEGKGTYISPVVKSGFVNLICSPEIKPNDPFYNRLLMELTTYAAKHCVNLISLTLDSLDNFELWNEPDIFYWNGTIAEYCKLYDYTERAIHEVCDELRISGPAVTGNFDREYVCRFFRDFLKHCKSGVNFCTGETGTRLDFITYHVKGGGFPFEMHAEKAVPSVERLVQLTKIGLDIICECGYQGLEVVLSEADPDGWAAGGVYDNANMIFRNTEYYATYVASTYEKIEQLCHEYQMAVRPLAWAFMFPGERCFEGTRTFTTQGIDKAVFNLFKIYGSLGDTKLAFSSDGAETMEQVEKQFMKREASKPYTGEGEETDVSGFAVEGKNGETQILIYSHNNDRDEHSESTVTLTVEGLSGKETVECIHYRIDGEHSNPYAEWKRQGEPLFPEGEQYEAIKKRDGLEKLTEDTVLSVKDGVATLTFTMPAHAVSFVVLK